MLMVTQNAADAIDAVVSSAPVSDGAGVRISQQTPAEGQEGFSLALVEKPTATDQVIDIEGEHAPLFIESEAADALDDKVLDAQVQDGQIGFVIAQQA
jgi:iron-sulfur cluster assembly protein